jgi:hypothetical protein
MRTMLDDVARVLRRVILDAWRRTADDAAEGRESGVNDDMIDRCRRVTCAALRTTFGCTRASTSVVSRVFRGAKAKTVSTLVHTSARERTMRDEKCEDEEQLHPENSSGDDDAQPRVHGMTSMGRSALIALAACALGILGGAAFHGPPPHGGPGGRGGYDMHHRYVTEYDLVTIRYETPMAFETDVRALGVTDKEYKACDSSILRAPKQKICTKVGAKCYMKKLKNEKDASGNDRPTYVKEGATEVDCPSSGHSWLYAEDDKWRSNGWPSYCQKHSAETNTQINICYGELLCAEASSQWTAKSDYGYCALKNQGNQYVVDWTKPDTNDRFWCAKDSPAWYGGVDVSKMAYPGDRSGVTTPYEGKFCLQKAAFKALSRAGWELIEPTEAFKPSWTYNKNYANPFVEDEYAAKTYKVKKVTFFQ